MIQEIQERGSGTYPLVRIRYVSLYKIVQVVSDSFTIHSVTCELLTIMEAEKCTFSRFCFL